MTHTAVAKTSPETSLASEIHEIPSRWEVVRKPQRGWFYGFRSALQTDYGASHYE